jgi:hypothetical protein
VWDTDVGEYTADFRNIRAARMNRSAAIMAKSAEKTLCVCVCVCVCVFVCVCVCVCVCVSLYMHRY